MLVNKTEEYCACKYIRKETAVLGIKQTPNGEGDWYASGLAGAVVKCPQGVGWIGARVSEGWVYGPGWYRFWPIELSSF